MTKPYKLHLLLKIHIYNYLALDILDLLLLNQCEIYL